MTQEKISWSGRSFDYLEDELQEIVGVAKTADPLTKGKYLKQFEADFAAYLGVANCFGLTSAASALELSAILSGIKAGEEVIIPSHTYCASAIPFGRRKAIIKWADIDPKSLTISVESIKKLISSKTKVIVVVHLYGRPCDMDEIVTISKEHSIILIEDCAQALGAEYKGKKVGTFGHLADFSFHAQKNLTTLGEGGILVVNDSELAKKVPGLRHNGHAPFAADRKEYWKPAMSNVDLDIEGEWPYNFPLTEVQAALGSKLLKRVDKLNAGREKRWKQFVESFESFPELQFQDNPSYVKHGYHLIPAKYDGKKYGKTNSDLIQKMYSEFGIKCIVQYYPLNRYPLFQKNGFGEANCPNTDDFFDNMISFPFHLWMSDADFSYMIDSLEKTLKDLRG